ncbi:MAG: glycosyltransferase [Spirochaetales bacterium]
MKVAIVFEIFFPVVNGVITSSVNLAKNLRAQGHDVIFLAPETEDFTEPTVEGGIPVYYIQSSENWAYPGMRNVLPWNQRVQVILRQEKVDIVHITGPFLLTWAAIRAAKNLQIPVVHTFHTMLFEKSYIIYFFKFNFLVPAVQDIAWYFFGLFIRKSMVNTGPSRLVCDQMAQHFPRADVRYISNGVDVEQFEHTPSLEEVKANYPMFTEHTLLFVGRLGDEKSVGELVEAMSIVRQGMQQARLIIVGDGPGAARYKARTEELRLEHNVFFLGRIPHGELVASGLIHHARAFVTASTTENQPMTVIEAILCTRPVIVPRVPGITELVEGNGMTFRPHDVGALAAAMLRLLSDDEMAAKCSQHSRELKDRFDGRNVAKEFIAAYKDAKRKQKDRLQWLRKLAGK